MGILIVVNEPSDWPLELSGVEIVSSREYLTDPEYAELRGVKVFNLCRSYRYQSYGYYVSLLAAARGHKPLPSITTIQDLKLPTMVRLAGEELDELIQTTLKRLSSERFVLSIYFGHNMAQRCERLALALFNLVPAPLLRATFARSGDRWELRAMGPIPADEVAEEHWLFVLSAANEYFKKRQRFRRSNPKYDLAILYDKDADYPPSNPAAMRRFLRAAKVVGFRPEIVGKDDFGRIAEFDALFIRETTSVNHHTYRFARRAVAEGLVVIDDPVSIARCTNKVYLAELLSRNDLPGPKTMIVYRENLDRVGPTVGFPCVLKTPDSSFSRGVVKCVDAEELAKAASGMLERSDMVIAQEFLKSDFDWRVGIIDRKPLYVCRYHMAKGHWQILRTDEKGERHYGEIDTLTLDEAPQRVVRLALKVANLIGDGLYGVDLKQVKQKCYVMEVNDNPSIDAGFEDRMLKNKLYESVLRVLFDRVSSRRANSNDKPAK